MIENVHTERNLMKAMQVTPESLHSTVDGEDPPLTRWVIDTVGWDALWGGGKGSTCDVDFDDSYGTDWFTGRGGGSLGDWLVLTEDGLFFFVEQGAFEALFVVEGANVCPECRYLSDPHKGPGKVWRDPKVTHHSADCLKVAWMKDVSDTPFIPAGFRNDPPCRHDVIG